MRSSPSPTGARGAPGTPTRARTTWRSGSCSRLRARRRSRHSSADTSSSPSASRRRRSSPAGSGAHLHGHTRASRDGIATGRLRDTSGRSARSASGRRCRGLDGRRSRPPLRAAPRRELGAGACGRRATTATASASRGSRRRAAPSWATRATSSGRSTVVGARGSRLLVAAANVYPLTPSQEARVPAAARPCPLRIGPVRRRPAATTVCGAGVATPARARPTEETSDEMSATTTGVGLEQHGIEPEGEVLHNPTTSRLYADALERGDGRLAEGGPLVVDTGRFTGRSPKDKFVVREPGSEERIWWATTNAPIEEAQVRRASARRVVDHLFGAAAPLRDRRLRRCRPRPPHRRARRHGEPVPRALREDRCSSARPRRSSRRGASPRRSSCTPPRFEADPRGRRDAHGSLRSCCTRAGRRS